MRTKVLTTQGAKRMLEESLVDAVTVVSVLAWAREFPDLKQTVRRRALGHKLETWRARASLQSRLTKSPSTKSSTQIGQVVSCTSLEEWSGGSCCAASSMTSCCKLRNSRTSAGRAPTGRLARRPTAVRCMSGKELLVLGVVTVRLDGEAGASLG